MLTELPQFPFSALVPPQVPPLERKALLLQFGYWMYSDENTTPKPGT